MMDPSKNVPAEAQAKPGLVVQHEDQARSDSRGSVELGERYCDEGCTCRAHNNGNNNQGKQDRPSISEIPSGQKMPVFYDPTPIQAPEPRINEATMIQVSEQAIQSLPIQVAQQIIDEPIPQITRNTYSDCASALLSTMEITKNADLVIRRSPNEMMPKAKKRITREGKLGVALFKPVKARHYIMEVNGLLSILSETDRPPGGLKGRFLYEGLKKSAGGDRFDDVSIVLDANGHDSQFIRRSCEPNGILKHVVGSQSRLAVFVFSRVDLKRREEVTVPFDSDWKKSVLPLNCSEHEEDMDQCPMEKERKEAMEGGNQVQ